MPITSRASRRSALAAVGSGVAVLALLATGCSGGGNEPVAETTESSEPTPSETPVLTAPPTTSPEEKAEAEIIDTFEALIADRDEYYSNTSDYDPDKVATNPPSTEWRVTGQADFELSNWTAAWSGPPDLEQVGKVDIARHKVTKVNVRESGARTAESTACLDMTRITYQTYEGDRAYLGYEPDQYQTWKMRWIYQPNAEPAAGIDESGWYVEHIGLTRNEPC